MAAPNFASLNAGYVVNPLHARHQFAFARGVCGVGIPLALRGGWPAACGFCIDVWSRSCRAIARWVKTLGRAVDAKR
jgi:hypothetical protein